MDAILVANKAIGPGEPVFIVAEAGLNHNGDPRLARQLVEKAAECGADAVKFQTYRTAELFPPDHPDYAAFERAEFNRGVYESLMDAAAERGIALLSTPFDEASADLLDDLGVPAFKIGSGEVTHHAFLRHIAAKGKPVILSTGMSAMDEIDDAVDALEAGGCKQLALLHCVSAYPCPLGEANLAAIRELVERFGVPAGYSDHTEGNLACVAAAALGARIVEKHFTLSRHLPGWDHFFSHDPDRFKTLVEEIRSVEAALGKGTKGVRGVEESIHPYARRAVYAAKAIRKGEALVRESLAVRRPLGPLPAERLDAVLGKPCARDIAAGEALRPEDGGA